MLNKEQIMKRLAVNIVNQLFDLAEVSVEKRQAINDEADGLVLQLLQQTPCATGKSEKCVHPYESLVFYDGSVDCSKCLVQVFKADERIA